MNKYKILFKNTAIFTISNFASKFLVFLLLPIYTRVMTTADFGTSDLIINTISLLMPILTLSVSEGVLRYAMESKYNKTQVFTFGLKIIFLGFLILLLSYPLLIKFNIFKSYICLMYLLYITSTLNNYFNQFVRGIGKIELIGIVGIVSTIVTVVSNIVLLVFFNYGVDGYLISYLLMNIVCIVIFFFWGELYKYINLFSYDANLSKEMLEYNLPLIPNRVGWWIIMISSRYIVSFFYGAVAVGIFSAASRVPTIITTIYGVIQQAFLLSVINEYGKDDSDVFFARIYKVMNMVLLLGVAFIILVVKPLSTILFGQDFFSAWQLVPLLSLSIVFGSLHGFLTTIFSAVKQTKMLFYNALLGAVISLILSISFVLLFGVLGAPFATVITYFILWISLLYRSKEYVELSIDIWNDLLGYLVVFLQAVLVMFNTSLNSYIISSLAIILIIIIKFKDISEIVSLIKGVMKKRF